MVCRLLVTSRCTGDANPETLMATNWPDFFGFLVGNSGLTVFNSTVRDMLVGFLA